MIINSLKHLLKASSNPFSCSRFECSYWRKIRVSWFSEFVALLPIHWNHYAAFMIGVLYRMGLTGLLINYQHNKVARRSQSTYWRERWTWWPRANPLRRLGAQGAHIWFLIGYCVSWIFKYLLIKNWSSKSYCYISVSLEMLRKFWVSCFKSIMLSDK